MRNVSVSRLRVSFVISCILVLQFIQTTQPSQDLAGTQAVARWSDGSYYKGALVSSSTPGSLKFRTVNGKYENFRSSDWQALAPDIIPTRKSTLVGFRIVAQESSNRFQLGTVRSVGALANAIYNVRLDSGRDGSYNIDKLRLLLPGFTVHGRNCLDLLHKGYIEDGVYFINPDGKDFITAFCDQKTNGGGWTVFQRRLDGSIDFFLGWNSYKEGFGDLTKEFWLGNKDIHRSTSRGSQLLIVLEDSSSETRHASYGSFFVGTEAEEYILLVSNFSGTAGDSMPTHNGMKFSTKDHDNDISSSSSCAQDYKGAWWYSKCHNANLNGQYGNNNEGEGINWAKWKGIRYSLTSTSMKVKPPREQDRFYELVFSGGSSAYVLLPRITDLMNVTSCWWIKTEAHAHWSAVFSLYNYENTSLMSFWYHANGSYWLQVNNAYRTVDVGDFFITDGTWHHICIARLYSSGSWTLYQDGLKKASQTGLATGIRMTKGYLVIGRFKGNLTHFNMWDEYIDDVSRIKDLTSSWLLVGNIVPWPEVQFWRIGNVPANNVSFWKLSGFQSALINHIPDHQDKLLTWLWWSVMGKNNWAPCFRGTVDGWQSHVFHSKCDNKGPTVTLARKGSYLFGGFADHSWGNHSPALSIPSKKAFLFSLQPHRTGYGATKFSLLPGNSDKAIRADKNLGPCWGVDTKEMCFSHQEVNINPNGVFNDSGVTSLSTFFTGVTSFQADEIEVLVLEEPVCYSPCGEYETCDKIKAKCVCDPTFREEEICKLRQELQALRDRHCDVQWNSTINICRGRIFARYDVKREDSIHKWRCYHEVALTGDLRRYDTSKASNCYYTDNKLALEHFQCEDEKCRALGMEKYVILDSQITASSEWNAEHGAKNARLNLQAVHGQRIGAWSARYYDANQWLQVDFLKTVALAKVATQGRMGETQWVKTYSLSYSMNGMNFTVYQQSGLDKVFNGNKDQSTVVYHSFNPVIITRYVRVLPMSWHNHISMRVEFYECDDYGVLEADDLLSDANYLWTFDDVNDIKDLKGNIWAEVTDGLKTASGVRRQAIKASGAQGNIHLGQDTVGLLIYPALGGRAISIWIQYESKGPGNSQMFLAVGGQENKVQGKGIYLYQKDGGKEDLTFEMRSSGKSCSYTFGIPQRMWTHLVFTHSGTGGLHGVTLYRNGKELRTVVKECYDKRSSQISRSIRLGFTHLPLALFDDLAVWNKSLTKSQVEKLFWFYKGGANLYANVSLELTGDVFHQDLLNRDSQMFYNKTSWLESQVRSIYEDHAISKMENFLFWSMNYLAVNFTVRFTGTGYKEIEPLETSLRSRGMLGSTPVRYLDMQANDVYIKPLQVTAYNTSNTTLHVSWNEPEELTHGIFSGVEILYRLNGSSQKFTVKAETAAAYELKSLLPYTWYVITARPHTLEGEGRESEEVLARTEQGVPTSQPQNVTGFLNSADNLMVTWNPVPVDHQRGIILGYHVMYASQTTGIHHKMTVNASTVTVELPNLELYTFYRITVAAFTIAGQGPPSPAILVRSKEGVPSLPPPIISAHSTKFTSVMVTWKPIPGDRAHGIIKLYEVQLEGTGQRVFSCSSNFNIVVRNLEKSKVYKFRIAGYTSKGRGNFSEYTIVTTNIGGCRALGMENGSITDSQITASSQFGQSYAPSRARLNKAVDSSGRGAWAAASGDIEPWLQVEFNEKVTVVKVATQGRFDFDQWVKSYHLNYSQEIIHYQVYRPSGMIKLFQGNWDRNTVVYNVIIPVISARFIRILPKSWEGWASMRTEFYTCDYAFKVDPVNITNSVLSSTNIGLKWQPPDANMLGEAVSKYRLEIIDLLRGTSFNYTVNSSKTNVELDFLKPFTSYEFKVFGSTSTWEGNITDTIMLKTQEDAPSEPPRNFTVQQSDSTKTTLKWRPVDKYAINGELQGYKVKYKKTESPSNVWKTMVIKVNTTQQARTKRSVTDKPITVDLEGLKAYTSYTVTVLAFTIKDGVPTLATNFTTSQDVPNHSPTNVTAYNTSSKSINVTWQSIPPDHVNGIILAYHVIYRRVDKANDNITVATVNSLSFSVELTGLGKYKLYSIQVAGRTVVGLGNFSHPVFVRTAQDIPDDPPSHIRAIGIESTAMKVYWLPVSNETINGICLGYKLNVFNTAGQKIRNFSVDSSVLSLTITGLEIWTNYSMKMAAFTIVGDGRWSDAILEDTDEEIPNKAPANLTGKAINSTSVFVEWDPVVLPNIQGILRGYLVYYKEAPGSVHPSVLKNTTVGISVTVAHLVNLQKFTEYQIWVTAFTTRDGLLSTTILIQTHEDLPYSPPLYITYSSPSSTNLLLKWGPIPPQFKNGIIRGFKVEYQENQPNATVEVQERRLVNWALLSELKKFTVYSVRVRAFTSVGYGPENSITAITSQDVPSKPPYNVTAESHVTLTTIPVAWNPIDPNHIHGTLLGYKIRYQAVAIGQETEEEQPITEKRVNNTTFTLTLRHLEMFTLYRVDVLGYTVMGDGPPATDYAETCRCYERLTTTWYEFTPYVQASQNNPPRGLIPPLLSKLAVACCETCQSHGNSYVDFNSNGFNQTAKVPNMRVLKSSISNPTDFFFPVYGHKDQTHFAKEFGYHGLVESPGMAYVINTNSNDDMPQAVLMNIASCWPAVLLSLAITYLAGLVVWAVESRHNPLDFPPSFVLGGPEGFYWAFVSMTTVGYGDRAPISFAGRFLALFVILSGLVIFGLVNGIMATAITTVVLETDYKIYGSKVAAIIGTPEYRMGIRKNARMDTGQEYHTYEELYKALHERKVVGVLIDTYSAGSSRDLFENKHFRINKILDYSSTYGLVMGKEARKLRKCFNHFSRYVFANEILQHIQNNTKQLKEPQDSLPVERSTGMFDSNSTLFQTTLLITTTVLLTSVLLGIIYEIIRRLKARSKIQPHDSRQKFAAEMKEIVDDFNQNLMTTMAIMASKHEKQRQNFVKSLKTRHPSREYSSTSTLTEELYLPNPMTEVDC